MFVLYSEKNSMMYITRVMNEIQKGFFLSELDHPILSNASNVFKYLFYGMYYV